MVNYKVIQRGLSGRWTWNDRTQILRQGGEPIADAVVHKLKHVGLVIVTTKGRKGQEREAAREESGKEETEKAQKTYFSRWSSDESDEGEDYDESDLEGDKGPGVGVRERGV